LRNVIHNAAGIMILVLAVLAGTARAQDVEPDRDPFSSESRPGAAAPSPRDSEWGRDPFSNPFGGAKTSVRKGAVQPKEQGPALTGIIFNDDTRIAIVSGEVLREGGKLGDKQVAEIRMKSVTLMDASGHREELVLQDFTMGK